MSDNYNREKLVKQCEDIGETMRTVEEQESTSSGEHCAINDTRHFMKRLCRMMQREIHKC